MTIDRLRMRNAAELKRQNQGLVELSMLLERAKVRHYLASGTLLGAVRDNDFIPWDWDVQFYFRLEDVSQHYEELVGLMQASDFCPIKTDDSADHWKITVIKYDTMYEMTAWTLSGNLRVRRDWKMPARYFDDVDEIDFLGRKYLCMSPKEDYLSHCYGHDWCIPKRTIDKNVYLASTFFRKPRFQRIVEKWIQISRSKMKRLLSISSASS